MKQRNRRDRNKVHSHGRQNGHIGIKGEDVPKQVISLPQNKTKESDIFPDISPWLVCAVTMAVRANYVCQPKNWWILHPDEIYQTLEVAHSEVYGYGFRTHEYLTVPPDGNMTQMRYMEVQLGMRSMRSFLLPRFFIMISWLASAFENTVNPYILWRVSHSFVTSLLPFAVYKFTRALFRSHDTGVIAAILTAGSTHLAVFGTHTLINSFIGTPLFYALSLLFENILVDDLSHNDDNASICDQRKESVKQESPMTSGQYADECGAAKEGYDRNCVQLERHANLDSNHNWIKIGSDENISQALGMNGSMTVHGNETNLCDVNGNIPKVSNFHASVKQDSNVNNPQKEKTASSSPAIQLSMKKVWFASFLLSIFCYVRLDAAMFAVVTSLPFLNSRWMRRNTALSLLAGLVSGVLIGLLDDFKSYGFGVISPYYWFQFNVARGFSAKIYGTMEWSWYLLPLLENPAIAVLLMFSAIVMFATYSSDSHKWKCVFKLSIVSLILLVFYSMKSHKELRFLHSFLVLLFIIFAYSIHSCANILLTKSRHASHAFLFLTIVPFLVSQWYVFPSTTNQSQMSWTYSGNTQSHDVNACLYYVSRQDDVTGVYTDHMIHMTGGYTLLHRNVPILALVHYEFYEFSYSTRTTLKSANYVLSRDNITVNTFTESSEFVSMYRPYFILKHIISNEQYNYLILNVNSKFPVPGYDVVFTSGTKIVLERNPDTDQSVMDSFAATIPIGNNATLLTYEADWLIKFSQHQLARLRLWKALELEPKNVEAYKRLALSYTIQGDLKSSGEVMGRCVAAASTRACYANPKKIILHEAYNF